MNRRPLGSLFLATTLGLAALIIFELALLAPGAGSAAAPSTALPRTPVIRRVAPGGDGPRTNGGAQTATVARRDQPVSPLRVSVGVSVEHEVFLPLVRGTGTMTEARALWATRFDYSTITDVQQLMDKAAGANFNMVLFQVRGAADAYYSSTLEPWAARLSGTLGEDPGWDPLSAAIEAAHARGLELHAWLNVYPVWAGQTPPPRDTDPLHLFWSLSYDHSWDDWRVVDSDGVTMTLRQTYLWATPALTDVVDRVVSVTADIASRYDVDGIHLDYVRYPHPTYSYDPFSNAGYQAAHAREPDLTRDEWQRQQVTQLVDRVYREAILPHSEVRLSAAVKGIYKDRWAWDYPAGYTDYYQDSQGWIQSGTVDAIVPMLYTQMFISYPEALTPTQFSLVTSDFLTHAGGRHVFPGINAQHLDFSGVSERISIARGLGSPGHAIFSAGVLDQRDFWDDLVAGPYAARAVVPPMVWRSAPDEPDAP